MISLYISRYYFPWCCSLLISNPEMTFKCNYFYLLQWPNLYFANFADQNGEPSCPDHDPNRVPGMPANGCPSGSYDYASSTCCCGQHCCWETCKWDVPPGDCFGNLEKDLCWIQDPTRSGIWVAQKSKLTLQKYYD